MTTIGMVTPRPAWRVLLAALRLRPARRDEAAATGLFAHDLGNLTLL